jgi:hypothetical protein
MTTIFMDEGGDLGFDLSKARTSRNFIITFLFCSNSKITNKIVSKVFRSIDPKKRLRHSGTLHCSHEHPKVRWKMLYQSSPLNQHISFIFLVLNFKEKPSVYPDTSGFSLKFNPQKYFAYMLA